LKWEEGSGEEEREKEKREEGSGLV